MISGMQSIQIKKGLDLPVSGRPEQKIRPGNPVSRIALIGDDYIGMKPTMLVKEGDMVKTGQVLFTDKKNKGVNFTAPGCGTIIAVNRGPRRKFESIVIEPTGDDSVCFFDPATHPVADMDEKKIRSLLLESGMWTCFRTRPYGKIPAVDATPSSLFVTAIDSAPLAADPQVIIGRSPEEYRLGLQMLQRLLSVPIHYCTGADRLLAAEELNGPIYWRFQGPHPAGLPSTHIHFIDPVHEKKTVWHIGYQDVIALGHLAKTGHLLTERTVALAGAEVVNPALVTTRIGASLTELCQRELREDKKLRILSGSVLNGRESTGSYSFLGRYHTQVSVLEDSNGRALFNWLRPGRDRFSIKPLFTSALEKNTKGFPFSTALWGGRRAIYPLGTYDQVMPLDIIATSLVKALSVGDTEKSKKLGCLELIEEDLALAGFVCPGKNEFGTPLREVLTSIELDG